MIARNVDEIREIQAHGEALYRYLFMRKDIYHYLAMDHVLQRLGGFWQTTVKPGANLDPHKHERHEQVYYILEGAGRLTVGDETRGVRKGDAIYIPPDTSHGFYNDSDAPCVIIMVDEVLD